MPLINKQEPCPIEQLRGRLDYSPETGMFVWKVPPNNNVKRGQIAGRTLRNGYICVSVNGRKCLAHRLAWFYIYGEWPQNLLDHINGQRSDNRIDNLRTSDHTLNRANSKTRRNGLKGIRRNGNRWSAQVEKNGVVYYQGIYDTPEDAHEAYKKAAIQFFGNFARFE